MYRFIAAAAVLSGVTDGFQLQSYDIKTSAKEEASKLMGLSKSNDGLLHGHPPATHHVEGGETKTWFQVCGCSIIIYFFNIAVL